MAQPGTWFPVNDPRAFCVACQFEFSSRAALEGHLPCVKQLPGPVKYDSVNHPAHYTRGTIEVIDFILDQQLDYLLGQVVKYVARAGYKDPSTKKQDLQKAEFYLKRAIDRA